MIWKVRGRDVPLVKTLLMGILNVTPDSFSDGGNSLQVGNAVKQAARLLQEGADILDLGAESTRPGAAPVSTEEELSRLVPALRKIRAEFSTLISIDTTKPEVARICLEEGADIVNDVSGLKDSGPEMAHLVADTGAGLVLMHRRGRPETMQSLADYRDVISEVYEELNESAALAMDAGVSRAQIIMDPGLGFAKTAEQSLEILRFLERFHEAGFPILLGPSRKSFIGFATGRGTGEREFGTAAVCALAVLKGVHVLRVHEPAPMRDVVNMMESIQGADHVRS